MRRQMAAHLPPGTDISSAEAELAGIEARAQRILHGRALSSEDEVQLVELQDLEVDLREADASAAKLEAVLTDRARLLDGDIEQLQRARSRWSATLPASAEHEAPETIQKRAADILETIDGLKTDLKSRRDEALTSLDRVSRVRSDLAAARAQMSDRRSQAQRRIFEISEAPIWKTPWAGRRMGRGAGERLARDFARLSAFAGQRGPFAGARFLLLFAASFGLILAVRAPARESAKGDPHARGFLRLIDRPVAAAALIALMALVWWTPSAVAPALFWDALWVALILTTATLLNRLFAKAIWRSVDALALASCLVPLRYLYEQEPLLDRLVLLLQVGLVIAALALDWKSGRWQAIFRDKWPRRFVTAVLAISIVSLSAACVLAVLGYVGTARLLRTGTIATDGLGMISIGLYSLLYGIAGALALHASRPRPPPRAGARRRHPAVPAPRARRPPRVRVDLVVSLLLRASGARRPRAPRRAAGHPARRVGDALDLGSPHVRRRARRHVPRGGRGEVRPRGRGPSAIPPLTRPSLHDHDDHAIRDPRRRHLPRVERRGHQPVALHPARWRARRRPGLRAAKHRVQLRRGADPPLRKADSGRRRRRRGLARRHRQPHRDAVVHGAHGRGRRGHRAQRRPHLEELHQLDALGPASSRPGPGRRRVRHGPGEGDRAAPAGRE